jgi:molybdopterin synthase catalytic subunit
VGKALADVRVLAEPFDQTVALASFADLNPQAGAITSFVGQVRGEHTVEALELSHYAPLTLPGMKDLAAEAQNRWAIEGLLVWHRVGTMPPGEVIVLVAAAARHRRTAFEAVDFLVDHLKASAWFWKRERRAGQWQWIEPRLEDHADLARWTHQPGRP